VRLPDVTPPDCADGRCWIDDRLRIDFKFDKFGQSICQLRAKNGTVVANYSNSRCA
jgi:hypothetical protein